MVIISRKTESFSRFGGGGGSNIFQGGGVQFLFIMDPGKTFK